jgi:hypothetical protein
MMASQHKQSTLITARRFKKGAFFNPSYFLYFFENEKHVAEKEVHSNTKIPKDMCLEDVIKFELMHGDRIVFESAAKLEHCIKKAVENLANLIQAPHKTYVANVVAECEKFARLPFTDANARSYFSLGIAKLQSSFGILSRWFLEAQILNESHVFGEIVPPIDLAIQKAVKDVKAFDALHIRTREYLQLFVTMVVIICEKLGAHRLWETTWPALLEMPFIYIDAKLCIESDEMRFALVSPGDETDDELEFDFGISPRSRDCGTECTDDESNEISVSCITK